MSASEWSGEGGEAVPFAACVAVPLVNEELTDLLFSEESVAGDEEQAELSAGLWAGLWEDLPKDMAELQRLVGNAQQAKEMEKLAHRMAGYCGNCGLQRLGVVLRAISKNRLAVEDGPKVWEHLPLWAEESLSILRQRYPERGV